MLNWVKNKLAGAAAAGAPAAHAIPEQAVAAGEQYKRRGNAFVDQGNWSEAEACYRQAIGALPADPDAHINLGYVLGEQNRHAEARQILRHALSLDAQSMDAHYMLGTLALGRGDWPEAIAHLERTLAIKPDFEAAYRDLGRALLQDGQAGRARQLLRQALERYPGRADFHIFMANLHAQAGEPADAIRCFQSALALQPANAELRNILAESLKQQGRLDEAAEQYRGLLQLSPDIPEGHLNLGALLQAQGKREEAAACYRQALALRPDFAEAHLNIGGIHHAQGRLAQALEAYRRAVSCKPDFAGAHYNIGIALQDQGELEAAVASYRTALACQPEYADVYNNMGNALRVLDRLEEAVESYRKGLSLQPGNPEMHGNLGLALQELGQLDLAAASFEQALALKPDYAEAHSNLGVLRQACGALEQAAACYRKALACKPEFVEAHSNLIYALSFSAACGPDQYLAEARRFGQALLARATPYTDWPALAEPAPARLRVGLVSGDLKRHPVAYFLETVLARLDRQSIEVVAYPTHPLEDEVSARLKRHCAGWRSLTGLADQAAAQLIRGDGIHILIDLAGHTAHNRLPVFAWKPAPLQVSWLGYWASTGVPGMDYLLADPVSAPETQRGHFTETLWRLPDTRLCFTAPDGAEAQSAPVAPLPALRKGHVTFGSYQNLAKIDDAALALWGRVLAALPDARLRLQCKQMSEPSARLALSERLARAGIAPQRVELVGPQPRGLYLSSHGEVDMLLDTLLFPGGTTTCEALWMGVPTVTLAGGTMVSRQGASLMACAGLADWIAADADDFVARAVAHAGDVNRLAALRAGLRQQALASPLFDAVRFARNLEQALAAMWRERRNDAG